MKVGPVSVTLLKQGGGTFPEVHRSGTTYVVADFEQIFSLQATLDKNVQMLGATHFKVSIDVDGRNVGFSKNLSVGKHSSAVFEGFLLHGIDGAFKFAQFKFGKPTVGDISQNLRDVEASLAVGKVKITVIPEVVIGRNVRGRVCHNKMCPAVIPNNGEGKKWFQAPSLAATAAGTILRDEKWDLNVYQPVGPAFSGSFRYETATVLLLRGILNPATPEHRNYLGGEASLTAGAQPDRKHRKQSRNSNSPALQHKASTSKDPTCGVKAWAVDLTGEDNSRIILGNGRYLKPDEYATCDLTRAADGPMWGARKKPRVTMVV